jgi:hypothetical protein
MNLSYASMETNIIMSIMDHHLPAH